MERYPHVNNIAFRVSWKAINGFFFVKKVSFFGQAIDNNRNRRQILV